MDEKTITVTGRGEIYVCPDVTRVKLDLASIHESYEEAYLQATDNTNKLSKIMKEVNLNSSLPKTIRFDIDKKTETNTINFIITKVKNLSVLA